MICIYPYRSFFWYMFRFITSIIFYIYLYYLCLNRCLNYFCFFLGSKQYLHFLYFLFRTFYKEGIFTLLILITFKLVRSLSKIRSFLLINLLLFINNLDSFLIKLLKLFDLSLHGQPCHILIGSYLAIYALLQPYLALKFEVDHTLKQPGLFAY